jgi:hypothetical protein
VPTECALVSFQSEAAGCCALAMKDEVAHKQTKTRHAFMSIALQMQLGASWVDLAD